MKSLLTAMNELTARVESFALATVITRNGSAPRSAGARMLVRAGGASTGTVGGGILEAQVQQLAREVLETRRSLVKNFRFSGEDAATMDAICGGQVDVLVEWVNAADPAWREVLAAHSAITGLRQKAWLLTGLPAEGFSEGGAASPQSLPHAIVQQDGSVVGLSLSELETEKILTVRQPDLLTMAGRKWAVEPIDSGGAVYIFGAGHVGASLAQFTRAVGFWTVALDDRPEYANPQNVPHAHETIVLASFEDALGGLSIGPDSFIVIVTRGHLNDRVVLAQALKTEAGYIGMIGSRRKTALVFDELRKAGFGEADLQRVHAPIGLHIRAETPEEIGVSIVAEMIQVRAGLADPGAQGV